MAKINRILVPVDGSKNSTRGLDEAIKLAQAVNAKIIGLYVQHSAIPSTGAVTGAIRDTLKQEAERILDTARRRTLAGDVSFSEEIRSGPVGKTIVKFADDNLLDMIVIGSRGVSGLNEKFFGSVANHVLHASRLPVLIVK
jgi:nucleotide-binding universal stress UspA family protein